MKEVQIIYHCGTESFRGASGKGSDDVGPEEAFEGFGCCAPDVGDAEEEGGEDEDGALRGLLDLFYLLPPSFSFTFP